MLREPFRNNVPIGLYICLFFAAMIFNHTPEKIRQQPQVMIKSFVGTELTYNVKQLIFRWQEKPSGVPKLKDAYSHDGLLLWVEIKLIASIMCTLLLR
jgi:hypothetical protein